MKKLSGLVVAIMLGLTVSAQTDPGFVPLKELFKNDFLAGVAVNRRSITGDSGKSEGNGPRKPQIYEIDDSCDKLVLGKRYNP